MKIIIEKLSDFILYYFFLLLKFFDYFRRFKSQINKNYKIDSILDKCKSLCIKIEDLKRYSKDPSKKTNFEYSINYIKGIEESINRLKSAYEDAPKLRMK